MDENSSPDIRKLTALWTGQRSWSWLARLLLGLALLGWLWHSCSYADFARVFQALQPGPLMLALALSLGGITFSAVPWQRMLAAFRLQLSWLRLIVLSHFSFAVNNFVPGGLVGDAMRAWLAGRLVGRYEVQFATVLLDRWLSYLCLFTLAMVYMVRKWTYLCSLGLTAALWGVIAVFCALLILSTVLFVGNLPWSRRLLSRFAFGLSVARLSQTMVDYLHLPSVMLQCYVLTLVTPILDALVFFLISEGLQLGLPLWVYLLMVPVMRVIHHVPVSVNAVGTQDAACLFYLGAFGIAPAQALTVSLAMHAIKLSSAVISGCIYLLGAKKLQLGINRISASPVARRDKKQ